MNEPLNEHATRNPVYPVYRNERRHTIIDIGWSDDAQIEIAFWSNRCLTIERKTGQAGIDPEDFIELDPATIRQLQDLLQRPAVQALLNHFSTNEYNQ